MMRVGKVQLRLPAGFGPRAESIARQIANGAGQLHPTESRTIRSLVLPSVRIDADATESQVVSAVLRQLATALGVQS